MALISRKLNPNRSYALDVFRGLTMAGMILVNNPGGPSKYAPLEHAAWNGWTPTDLVFPSFAFIIGVSLMYSLSNRKAKTTWEGLSLFDYIVPILTGLMYFVKLGVQTDFFKHAPQPPIGGWDFLFFAVFALSIAFPQLERRACARGGSLWLQVLHHGFLIFSVGFIWAMDPTNPGGFRILGVLHRLGMVYIAAGLIVLAFGRRGQIAAVAGLLAFYWIIMKYWPVPGCGAGKLTLECNPAGYFDNLLMHGHLYRPNWEPEGLLHTIPSIATGLLGCLAGGWLRSEKQEMEKIAGLSIAGGILVVLGIWLNYWFPINKNLWSPSYVIFCAGLDMAILAACFWFIDFKGWKKFSTPFVSLGANSIFIYLLSGTFIHYFSMIPMGKGADGADINIKQYIYEHAYASWLNQYNASLGLSLTYVAMWMFIGWLLYRKKVFFKL